MVRKSDCGSLGCLPHHHHTPHFQHSIGSKSVVVGPIRDRHPVRIRPIPDRLMFTRAGHRGDFLRAAFSVLRCVDGLRTLKGVRPED
jgi:hypothetical protein